MESDKRPSRKDIVPGTVPLKVSVEATDQNIRKALKSFSEIAGLPITAMSGDDLFFMISDSSENPEEAKQERDGDVTDDEVEEILTEQSEKEKSGEANIHSTVDPSPN